MMLVSIIQNLNIFSQYRSEKNTNLSATACGTLLMAIVLYHRKMIICVRVLNQREGTNSRSGS